MCTISKACIISKEHLSDFFIVTLFEDEIVVINGIHIHVMACIGSGYKIVYMLGVIFIVVGIDSNYDFLKSFHHSPFGLLIGGPQNFGYFFRAFSK